MNCCYCSTFKDAFAQPEKKIGGLNQAPKSCYGTARGVRHPPSEIRCMVSVTVRDIDCIALTPFPGVFEVSLWLTRSVIYGTASILVRRFFSFSGP